MTAAQWITVGLAVLGFILQAVVIAAFVTWKLTNKIEASERAIREEIKNERDEVDKHLQQIEARTEDHRIDVARSLEEQNSPPNEDHPTWSCGDVITSSRRIRSKPHRDAARSCATAWRRRSVSTNWRKASSGCSVAESTRLGSGRGTGLELALNRGAAQHRSRAAF